MIYVAVLDKKFESLFEGVVAYIYELGVSQADSTADNDAKN